MELTKTELDALREISSIYRHSSYWMPKTCEKLIEKGLVVRVSDDVGRRNVLTDAGREALKGTKK